jgi:TRAP transporter TAXI family solute receptor
MRVVFFSLLVCIVCGGIGVIGAPKQYIRMGTAGSSGTVYPLCNQIAQVWNAKIPGVQASAQATAGAAQNLRLLADKEAEIGICYGGMQYYAFYGHEMYEGNPMKWLRGLFNLHPVIVHFVVRADSGVQTLSDLRGKKVAIGAIGSGLEIMTREILGVHGINTRDKKDLQAQYIGLGEAADQIKNGFIDGASITGGLPTSVIIDLATSTNIRLITIDDAMMSKVCERYPFYFPVTIPAGTYPRQTQSVQAVASAQWLVTRGDLGEDLIYNLTKTLFENLDMIHTTEIGRLTTLDKAVEGQAIPLHPGAERYFREVGIVK